MKTYQRIITGGLVLVGLAGLLGCDNKKNELEERPTPTYFASIPMSIGTGLGMTSGDFDGDGDLDLIIGAKLPDDSGKAKTYRFYNDGNGNLSQRIF
ncbi:hypothetical protein GOV05_01395 [Candidatus Woesearchaeota archaeon]|nr:hypothetical protein [Candidatus Woesearchaeota archaeon]